MTDRPDLEHLREVLPFRDYAELAAEGKWQGVNERGQIMGEFGPLSDDVLQRISGHEVNSLEDVTGVLLDSRRERNLKFFTECDIALSTVLQLGHGSGVMLAKELQVSTEQVRKMRRLAELVPGDVREEGADLQIGTFHDTVRFELAERERIKAGEHGHAMKGVTILRRGIRDGLTSGQIKTKLKEEAGDSIWVSGGTFDFEPGQTAKKHEILGYISDAIENELRVKIVVRVMKRDSEEGGNSPDDDSTHQPQ